MATLELSMDKLEDTITNNEIVMIDFWAQWCGPCKMFGPVFEKASEKHEDIAFTKVNTEEDPELAAHFGVRSIPTLAIFRDKILLYKQAGALPEAALDEIITKVRDLDMDKVRAQIAEEEAQKA
jgi:thioredoxin